MFHNVRVVIEKRLKGIWGMYVTRASGFGGSMWDTLWGECCHNSPGNYIPSLSLFVFHLMIITEKVG
jgi:hypothetical protein